MKVPTDSKQDGTSSASTPDPTVAQIALQIPEILLNIFTYSSKSDLPSISLVCRAFTSPAYSFLYQYVSLEWDKNKIEALLQLLRSFDANPKLYTLVKCVDITYYDGEASPGDPDASWTNDGQPRLVNCLGHLQRLRHLSLDNLQLDDRLPTVNSSLQNDLDRVMGGLVSLQVIGVTSSFWVNLCGRATSLQELDLMNPSALFLTIELPPLLHLELSCGMRSWTELWAFASGFSKTLETLQLIWFHQDFLNFQSTNTTFDRLTHLYLRPPKPSNLQPIQSILQSMPCLRHLRFVDWTDGGSQALLPLIIPFVSSSITRIETFGSDQVLPVESFVEGTVVACSKHLPARQYDLRIYLPLMSLERITELTNKRLYLGVKLAILDSNLFWELPTLVELSQDERRK